MAAVLALVLLAASYRVLEGEMEIGTLVSVVGVAVFFEEPARLVTAMVSIFAPGEVVAVVGSTGAGKSTLALVAAGSVVPT